jgi:hypothetical protein
MGDTQEDKLAKAVFKTAIDHLFWKRRWFRKWFINIPSWLIVAIPVLGHDSYYINFYLSLYCFLLTLSLYDRDLIDDEVYPRSKTKKLRAKKAAY